jgi:hypothetical protein
MQLCEGSPRGARNDKNLLNCRAGPADEFETTLGQVLKGEPKRSPRFGADDAGDDSVDAGELGEHCQSIFQVAQHMVLALNLPAAIFGHQPPPVTLYPNDGGERWA